MRATPIGESGEPIDRSELVIFDDYRSRGGALIPTKLEIFEIRPEPQRPAAVATIEITKLDLEPRLEPAAFTRPKT